MTCRDSVYQKFCAQVHRNVPCCEEIDRDYLSYSLSSSNISDEVCVAEIFELAKIIVEKKMIKFFSRGVCMFPSLRPKDVLYIEPKTAEQIQVGDIAVFSHSNRLYAHRTIDKGQKNGSYYILTRPDTARYGNDDASFDNDILGIVNNIERKGKVLSPQKKDYILVKRLFWALYIHWYHLERILFNKTVYLITHIQQFKIYRKIATFLFSRLNKKIIFSIQIPLNSKITSRFHRIVSLEEFIMLNLKETEDEMILKWTIRAQLDSKPVSFLSLMYRPRVCPFSGWWLLEAKIKIDYRGTGIEEKLFGKAEFLLKQLKISQIFIGFFKDEHLNRKVFRNFGFEETTTYEEKLFKIKDNKPACWIIMQKKII